MKYLIAMTLTATLIMTGCSSAPDYRKAEDSGYGYQETQLSDNQYRVHFTARGSDKRKAMDFAMLRAAELTLLQGYDWFTVTHRETLVDSENVGTDPQIGFSRRYEMERECGLITCSTSMEPETTYSAGVFVGGERNSQVEAILNITMGKGEKPDSAASFNAKQVRNNLQPQAE